MRDYPRSIGWAQHGQRVHCLTVVAIGIVALGASYKPEPARAELIVGSFDLSRGGRASIAESPDLDIELLRGVVRVLVKGVTFTATPELTPEYLSTVDVFVAVSNYTSSSAITPLSAAEQAALFNYVVAGGDLILAMENIELSPTADITHESFLDPFGMSITGVIPGTTMVNVLELDHPIFDGEMGQFPTYLTSRTGWFDELGPYARPLAESAVNQEIVMAFIDRNVIAPGSGRVLITGDTQIWEIDINLTGNMVLYFASVPEPGAWASGMLGALIAAGWGVSRGRKRPRS